jgi:formylglycine-generating enzyme required for sulfatase activity
MANPPSNRSLAATNRRPAAWIAVLGAAVAAFVGTFPVTRGGSFLRRVDYCESYRPAARRGTPYDTGMSHIGFRCVRLAK